MDITSNLPKESLPANSGDLVAPLWSERIGEPRKNSLGLLDQLKNSQMVTNELDLPNREEQVGSWFFDFSFLCCVRGLSVCVYIFDR